MQFQKTGQNAPPVSARVAARLLQWSGLRLALGGYQAG